MNQPNQQLHGQIYHTENRELLATVQYALLHVFFSATYMHAKLRITLY